MVKVFCNTNLDAYKKEIWPDSFGCRPIIGDFVLSKNGVRLRICEITHSQRQINSMFPSWDTRNCEPILIIELHN